MPCSGAQTDCYAVYNNITAKYHYFIYTLIQQKNYDMTENITTAKYHTLYFRYLFSSTLRNKSPVYRIWFIFLRKFVRAVSYEGYDEKMSSAQKNITAPVE